MKQFCRFPAADIAAGFRKIIGACEVCGNLLRRFIGTGREAPDRDHADLRIAGRRNRAGLCKPGRGQNTGAVDIGEGPERQRFRRQTVLKGNHRQLRGC
ncbi:hypothetical protein D3C86_1846250 [compost metagenome]